MLTRGKAETVLAYTAGIIDGEGCISIKHMKPARPELAHKFSATLSVGNTDHDLILWLQEQYGGYVYPKMRYHASNKLSWGWEAVNKVAYEVLVEVLPYLRVKRAQAELLIQYWEGKKRYNRQAVQDKETGRFTMHPGAPAEETAWRLSIHQQIKALNQGQPQRLTEGASRTEDVTV